jgi:hypothetical protein
MRFAIAATVLLVTALSLCGCENFHNNLRQTGKNMNALLLDGYDEDLYGQD